jgi:YegS/Rv2252/BmrU family lipid kinase
VNRTLLLLNPNARSGDIDREAMIAELERIGPVIAPECSKPASMQHAVSQYADSVQRIVIGGGDGTLNNALSAVLQSGLPLGVLPLGTANDFARSLGIADLPAAVDVILAGHTQDVDVGLVNDRRFLNAVGIGLGPRINRALDSATKARFGVASYLLNAYRTVRNYRGTRAVIQCDGTNVSVRSMHISIGNGIHYGGGMTISRDAKLDDGLLRVISIRPQTFLSLLTYGPSMRTGDVADDENLQTFAGRTVIVRTRRTMEVTADGELVTKTPVECRSLRRALTVFVPAAGDP